MAHRSFLRGVIGSTVFLAVFTSCEDPPSSHSAFANVAWSVDTVRGVSYGIPMQLKIRGLSSDDLFLVAWLEPVAGEVFHFDGVHWSRPSLPSSTSRIYDVAAFGSGVAIAAGASHDGHGMILNLEGDNWVEDGGPVGAPTLLAIGGICHDSLIVASTGGQLFERLLAPYYAFKGWAPSTLQRYGIPIDSGMHSRPVAIEPFGPRGLVMTYHDLLGGSYPVTRLLTWNGWWWSEVAAIWGYHTIRGFQPEEGHTAWVTSNSRQVVLNMLDHGEQSSTTVQSSGGAVDMTGTSLDDVLVLTPGRLFRMNARGHQAIPGPWDDRVILSTAWTNGPEIVVAGRSLVDLRVTVVYRGRRNAW